MADNFAPIALFVYNRPEHTKQVLDALAKNEEAKESVLFIFCDGPKTDASNESIKRIEQVRSLVKAENRFKRRTVLEQMVNKGLANSIIDGVSQVLSEDNEIIVLEDDIVVSKGFLKYMNEALSMYNSDERVGCIHGWNYPLKRMSYKESTFFLKGADCWGWATWKRAWTLFRPDGAKLLREIISRHLEFDFNRRGTHNFVQMLKDQVEEKNDSWAIRWHASLFLQDKYCLQPTCPIVRNIGLDNSGIHSGIWNLRQEPVDFIDLKKLEIKEEDWFFKSYSEYVNSMATYPSSGLRTIANRVYSSIKQLLN